jgi:XTP/dITP diphosphohydrolase
VLRYVTTNPGKVREARDRLPAVDQLDFDYPEIQSPDLGPIAAAGARAAHRHAGDPVLVDDAGLFVAGFDGFPGPYSSFVEETVGIEAVGRLCDRELDALDASFRCVLGYCDGTNLDAPGVNHSDGGAPDAPRVDTGENGDALPVALFEGVVEGRIVPPRGDGGFGYDPIFEVGGTTFAEMTPDEKNDHSHRGRALDIFANWYDDR